MMRGAADRVCVCVCVSVCVCSAGVRVCVCVYRLPYLPLLICAIYVIYARC